VLALVLTVFVAIPAVAASTFAWSGEVTSQFQTNFKGAAESVLTANVTLGVTINDNLSFTGLVITTANAAAGSTGALTNGNGAFDATVQLGKIFGMDPKTFGEALTIGNVAPGGTAYGASVYANEEVFGAAMTAGKVSIVSLSTISNMINVYLGFDPASFIGTAAVPQYIADVYGTFGPVNASLAYGSNQQQTLNVAFSQAMGDMTIGAAVGENYDLKNSIYKIGVGGKFAYKTLATVGVGVTYGGSPAALGVVDISLNLVPAATYGLDVYTSLDTANSMFNGAGYLDISAWTKLDASTLRVGYAYTGNATGNGYWLGVNWGGNGLGGGLYFVYDLTF